MGRAGPGAGEGGLPTTTIETPWILVLAFGLPIIPVVAWFLARLFGGRWLDQPEPLPDPPDGRPGFEPDGDGVLRVDDPAPAQDGVARDPGNG